MIRFSTSLLTWQVWVLVRFQFFDLFFFFFISLIRFGIGILCGFCCLWVMINCVYALKIEALSIFFFFVGFSFEA